MIPYESEFRNTNLLSSAACETAFSAELLAKRVSVHNPTI